MQHQHQHSLGPTELEPLLNNLADATALRMLRRKKLQSWQRRAHGRLEARIVSVYDLRCPRLDAPECVNYGTEDQNAIQAWRRWVR